MVNLSAYAAALVLALAPAVAAAAAPVAYAVERTEVLTLTAADGHPYRILVAWPDTPPPPEGWPVIYVLDGEDNFAIVTQTQRRLARAGGRSGVEPKLIVGIESGNLARRVLDYTPATPGWTIPAGAPAAGLPTGGAEGFLDFISDRVSPDIARRWHIDGCNQAIIGHSFGGLLVLHALLTRPGLFEAAVAVSPSLWFGGDLLQREGTAYHGASHRPLRLMVAVGGGERSPIGGGAPAAGEQLVQRLKAIDPAAKTVFLELAGQAHGATFLAGLTPALGFLSERGQK